MSPSPSRCTHRAESMITIQRQMLAQKILETKSTMTTMSRALSPSGPRYPTRDSSAERRHHQPHSNRRMVMAPSVSRPSNSTALIRVAKDFKSSHNYKKFNGDDDHSVSTATMTTMTYEQAPPLHLSTFKPAVGCITDTDFLVRCFVTRLRSGVTVMKHSRSRFRKSSRPCILMLEDNGEILTWKPAQADSSDGSQLQSHQNSDGTRTPPRSKRLSLFSCREVRLATTPDSDNPHYTGSAVLRDKCQAADAHKSFALIFGHRTLDITSMTADQCKMLTEGFSALCYRLHVRQAEQRGAREHYRGNQGPRGCFRSG